MVLQNTAIAADKGDLRLSDGGRKAMHKGVKQPKKKTKPEKKYFIMLTDDAGYMPVSISELKETEKILLNKLEEKIREYKSTVEGRFPQPDPELLQPKVTITNMSELRVHIISLLASAVLASVLIMMAILAALVSSLPHPIFWAGMSFPACGIALANLIVLLSGGEDERRK